MESPPPPRPVSSATRAHQGKPVRIPCQPMRFDRSPQASKYRRRTSGLGHDFSLLRGPKRGRGLHVPPASPPCLTGTSRAFDCSSAKEMAPLQACTSYFPAPRSPAPMPPPPPYRRRGVGSAKHTAAVEKGLPIKDFQFIQNTIKD